MDAITIELIDLDEAFFETGAIDWQEQGLCNQTDPEIFFPEKGGSTRQAKQVCAACPVRAECLDWALERRIRYGLWGGLSAHERRKLEVRPEEDTTPQPLDLPVIAAVRHQKGTAA